ncbi:class I SAM-dependent methyltransferase [Phenylobacterium sp. LjRoot219]|uniref:class I SAM-dependent methyltransferase n=1 Tax=Phenylobacterium sp. LjRoot219 TaxID=3342283 RepID=UPI003ECF7824
MSVLGAAARYIRSQQTYENPRTVAARLRRRRAAIVCRLIEDIAARAGGRPVSILDLGGSDYYWAQSYDREFLAQHRVRITILNQEPMRSPDPMITVVTGDACQVDAPDRSFDLVHSNSVIEHVGDWPKMEAFAKEVRRLADTYYVQTPYYGFPIEPHFSTPFFHWRSEEARAAALLKRGYGFIQKCETLGQAMTTVQEFRLLGRKQFGFLFPDAEHRNEKLLGLTKSLIAVRRGPAAPGQQ